MTSVLSISGPYDGLFCLDVNLGVRGAVDEIHYLA
jgi:hypothetical protein